MNKKVPAVEKLDIYSQKIIDDLFDMSDKDIMMEISEGNGNTDEIVSFTKNIFENVKSNLGKSRLTAARSKIDQQINKSTVQSAAVINIDKARRLLNNIKDSNNLLSQNVTLAARNLDTLSDEEILSLYSDLIELGLTDDGDFE